MRLVKKAAGLRLNLILVWLPVILMLTLLFGQADRATAAITLISFTATGRNGDILVEWETATELDNLGFFVQASDQEMGTYTRIGNFIVSTGDGLTGSTYSYIDNNVTPGVRKYYKLESVANNQTSELTSPISAVPGQASDTATSSPTTTSTLTPTSTSTSTPIPTETSIYSSAYPAPPSPTSPYPEIVTTVPAVNVPTTAVPVWTSTSTPGGLAGLSPVPTGPALASPSTVQPQELPIQEGTLIPLPSITIQFVEGTAIAQELSLPANLEQPKEEEQSSDSGRWARYGTLGFILLIWALLGGWFWFSIRKVE